MVTHSIATVNHLPVQGRSFLCEWERCQTRSSTVPALYQWSVDDAKVSQNVNSAHAIEANVKVEHDSRHSFAGRGEGGRALPRYGRSI